MYHKCRISRKGREHKQQVADDEMSSSSGEALTGILICEGSVFAKCILQERD